jgi:hypothetical protein
MEVPLRLKLPAKVLVLAEIMLLPGAKMSMQIPKLDSLPEEKYALESSGLVAPTVIALAAEAGDVVQASTFPFPPATTMTTPAVTAPFTAVFTDSITTCASMLRFATAPFGRARPTTQSIPARTLAKVPDPEPSKTLTAIKLAFLAIPYLAPPTVPGKVKECEISK